MESYTTLIRPKDISFVASRSGRVGGINREAVANAPAFEEVCDRIFNILNGRICAGHNIQRFDCVRIKAFAEVGKPGPVPLGIIDSLGVLTERFGRRAGNMKMATLAAYFGLGKQKHRSLEDVRMNLKVLKHCATVLFLESSLPSLLDREGHSSCTITTRSRSNGRAINCEDRSRKFPSIALGYHRAFPYERGTFGKMTQGVQTLLSKAQGTKSLSTLLRHSHSLLRWSPAGDVLIHSSSSKSKVEHLTYLIILQAGNRSGTFAFVNLGHVSTQSQDRKKRKKMITKRLRNHTA